MEKTENLITDFGNMDIEQKILIRSSMYKVPAGKDAEEVLKMIKERTDGIVPIPVRKAFRIKLLTTAISVAAGILILAAVWQLFVISGNVRTTAATASIEELWLPDGTHVQINAGSFVKWNRRNFSKNRNVNLSGEAFFDVAKGSPFIINASSGSIKVLGTSFNVFARGDAFKVSCLTGRVEVSAAQKSVVISHGESAELSGDELKNYQEKYPERIKSWIDGEFFFENACLSIVFDELERQFDVNFTRADLNDKFFTGSFTNKDLKSALEIVCIPMGLNYEIGTKNKIFISPADK